MNFQLSQKEKDDIFVWTEIVNCGEIVRPMLNSFLKYHSVKIHVFGFESDLANITPHSLIVAVPIDREGGFFNARERQELKESFERGHEGTAKLWGYLIRSVRQRVMIHLDADTIFLGDVVEPIASKLLDGCSVAGPRRVYRNHTGKITQYRRFVFNFFPDTVHTYAFGFNRLDINGNLNVNRIIERIQGQGKNRVHQRFFPVLDFFDRVTFDLIRRNGVFYFDCPLGSGPASSGFESIIENRIISFAAVGSGCAFYFNRAKSPSVTYTDFALKSFSLFAKYLLDFRVEYPSHSIPEIEERLKRLDTKNWTLH